MKRYLLFASLTLLFLIAGCSRASHEALQPDGALVRVPIANLQPLKASFFAVTLDGKDIRFFAVKGSNGQVRTALDACDVCYKERKGYQQQGDVMLCRNCNLTFPIDRIGPSSMGGCNPHFLPSQVAGDQLVLSVDDLKKGARFFP